MPLLSRNSCAKAFGNWPRGNNSRFKKPSGFNVLPVLRVKIFYLVFLTQTSYIPTQSWHGLNPVQHGRVVCCMLVSLMFEEKNAHNLAHPLIHTQEIFTFLIEIQNRILLLWMDN